MRCRAPWSRRHRRRKNDGASPADALLAVQVVGVMATVALTRPLSPAGREAPPSPSGRGRQSRADGRSEWHRSPRSAARASRTARWPCVGDGVGLRRPCKDASAELPVAQPANRGRRRGVQDLLVARLDAMFAFDSVSPCADSDEGGGVPPSRGSSDRSSFSRCRSRPGCSKGLRRRRCGSANSAALRMSSARTVSRPCHDASARAALCSTRSARRPSTSNSQQSRLMKVSSVSLSVTRGRSARARTIWCCSAACSSAHLAAKATASVS